MSFFAAKWYLYIVTWKKTGRWPDKTLRRWVRQSLRMKILDEKLADSRRD